MKNYEKYADEIKKCSDAQVLCDEIRIPFILKPTNKSCTNDIDCDTCQMLTMVWLLEDYKEPEVDWSKVKVDTPVLVREYERENWVRRYFAKYEGGKIYVWNNGRTSWTESYMTPWKFARRKSCPQSEIQWASSITKRPILISGRCCLNFLFISDSGVARTRSYVFASIPMRISSLSLAVVELSAVQLSPIFLAADN